jgi:hypothetical protein
LRSFALEAIRDEHDEPCHEPHHEHHAYPSGYPCLPLPSPHHAYPLGRPLTPSILTPARAGVLSGQVIFRTEELTPFACLVRHTSGRVMTLKLGAGRQEQSVAACRAPTLYKTPVLAGSLGYSTVQGYLGPQLHWSSTRGNALVPWSRPSRHALMPLNISNCCGLDPPGMRFWDALRKEPGGRD